jgi:Na+/melibiose symporter-like transporter
VNQPRKTTLAEKFAWGAGGVTESLVNSLYQLAFPVFSIGMGVAPALMGLAQSLPRFIDAFTDPIMGNISDNARTRWGRRRPFIFAGALLMAIAFPLIFLPSLRSALRAACGRLSPFGRFGVQQLLHHLSHLRLQPPNIDSPFC